MKQYAHRARRAKQAIVAAVAAMVVMLALGGTLIARYSQATLAARGWLNHSHQVVEAIGDLRNGSLRSLLQSRSYALTGDPRYRSNFNEARDETLAALDRLTALVTDNAGQTARADRLRSYLENLLQFGPTPPGADYDTRSSAIRDYIDHQAKIAGALRDEFRDFMAAEQEVLERRDGDLRGTLKRTIFLLVATAGAAAAAGAAAVVFLYLQLRGNSQRFAEMMEAKTASEAAHAALAKSERRLQATLDSAQDAVLVVDDAGLIRQANCASARVFGAEMGELLGRPAAAILPSLDGARGAQRETMATHLDGTAFPAEVTVGSFSLDDRPASVWVVRDVTERYRLARLKSEFVSTVSHELRTPLTSIRGSLGLIAGGAAGPLPPKAHALLEIAHSNCRRLVDLVNDILDIEKIESGGMAFRDERLDLGELVEQAIEANEGLATQHNVRLALVARPERPALVRGDADRLVQVVTNLLSNAAKFSRPDRPVEVSLTPEGASWRVAVRDHGCGVPESFKGRIFQRFAQADSSDRRSTGGTGLGLSIAKAIVERHGGAIGYESPLPGGGSAFWFTLAMLDEAAPAAPQPAAPAPRRVLVCEDDKDVAALLALMLEQDGWAADVVRTGEDALRRLAVTRYDAMTIDVVLPGIDGIKVIQHLRADPRTRDLPVAVVSARAREAEELVAGDAVTIIDWLKKPVDRQKLRTALRTALPARSTGPVRILHVEDDRDIVAVVAAIMEGAATVVPAPSLAAARARLANERFDLAILDLNLPDGSGLDLLDTIRARPVPMPVMILSVEDYQSAHADAVAASLVKSRTDNDTLFQTIAALIDPKPVAAEEPA